MTLKANPGWICSTLETAFVVLTLTQPWRWLTNLEEPRRREKSSSSWKRWISSVWPNVDDDESCAFFFSSTPSTQMSRNQRTLDPLRTSLSVLNFTTKWKMEPWCLENSNTFSFHSVSYIASSITSRNKTFIWQCFATWAPYLQIWMNSTVHMWNANVIK